MRSRGAERRGGEKQPREMWSWAFPVAMLTTHTGMPASSATRPLPAAAARIIGVIVDVIQLIPARATIRPWVDPVVDARGHDPRSIYVERYWLSVIGPTATWIMRRFAECFDSHPDGFELDLEHTASTMGLSYSKGTASPFGKALHRCVMFGLAQPMSDGFAVRRRLPSVAQRHLRRLPDDLQAEHDDWARRTFRVDARDLERRLIDAGIPPVAAVRATEFAAWAS